MVGCGLQSVFDDLLKRIPKLKGVLALDKEGVVLCKGAAHSFHLFPLSPFAYVSSCVTA